MLIDCPGCSKSYHIIKAALGPKGRRVACPRCDTIWFVATTGADGDVAPLIPATIEMPAGYIQPSRKWVANPPVAAPPPAPRQRSSFLKEVGVGVTLLVSGMAFIGCRAEIVRLCPPTSAVYASLGLPVNLRGLELRDLHTVSTQDGAEPVLGVEGEIANVRDGATPVPPIELTIRDANGHALYSWTATPQKHWLAVGETLAFRAKLAEPPPGARDVLARFAAVDPETVASR
jgi:predicted Zn finger-like uncharacterized protein